MFKTSFDLSLARGLDYYTGIIYEAIVEGSAPPGFAPNPAVSSTPAPPAKKAAPKPKAASAGTEDVDEEIDESQVGIGSIAAGGRYDNLVSLFTAAASDQTKNKKVPILPCVGVSFGLERIFSILYPRWVNEGRTKETMVWVMAAGDGLVEERMRLVGELRNAGIKTDFVLKAKPKLPVQFAAGEKDFAPFAVILGVDELKAGLVTVKEQKWEIVDGKRVKIESSADDKGTKVKRAELLEWIKASQVWQEWASRGV